MNILIFPLNYVYLPNNVTINICRPFVNQSGSSSHENTRSAKSIYSRKFCFSPLCANFPFCILGYFCVWCWKGKPYKFGCIISSDGGHIECCGAEQEIIPLCQLCNRSKHDFPMCTILSASVHSSDERVTNVTVTTTNV
jgi:hypothetical protein